MARYLCNPTRVLPMRCTGECADFFDRGSGHLKKTFAILTAVGCVAVALSAGPAMPPRSYLVSPVRTVDDLVRQLENPSVLNAYIRHYQAPRAEIEAFFKSLRIARAGKDYRVPVYFFDRSNGRIDRRPHSIKATDLLFVTKGGVPMMMVKCGNPFATKIWMPKAKIRAAAADEATRAALPEEATAPSSVALAPVTTTPVVENPAEIKGVYPDPVEPIEANTTPQDLPAEPQTPSVPGELINNPAAVNMPTTTIPVTNMGGSGNMFGILSTLLGAASFVPLTGSLQNGNSGAGGAAGGSGVTPVPEPATMVVVAAGVAALARRRRKS